MIAIKKALNGIIIVVPIIAGAYLSGMVYLSEGSAIPFTAFQLALIFGCLLLLFKQVFQREFSFHFYGVEVEYLLYLTIIFFSLIYSPERAEGLFNVIRYMVLIVLTYVIYNSINTEKELRTICYSVVAISIIIAIPSIVESVLNPEVAALKYINAGRKIIRSSGAERDPNIFGSYFILPVLILVALIGQAKSFKKKISLFGVCGIILAAVLLTYSRSTWVALFFGIGIVVLYQRNFNFILYSFVALLLIFLGSEAVRTIVFSVGDRVLDIFAGTSDDSSRFRIILMETAILMWLDSYMFGVGYQGFSTAFQKYYPPQEVGGVYEPHNEYYTVLAELGLIGFVVFLFLLWKIVKTGWNTVKKYEAEGKDTSIALALFASFCGYLVFFQFLGGMQLHSILTINIGLLFCASKFVGKREETESVV